MLCGECPAAYELDYVAPATLPEELCNKTLAELRVCHFDMKLKAADHECETALETFLQWWGNAWAVAEARMAKGEVPDLDIVHCVHEPFWTYLETVAPQVETREREEAEA